MAEPGEYEFELRRWPREAGLALTAGLPATRVTDGTLVPGVALPIAQARIFAGGVRQAKRVEKGDVSAVFRLKLKKGPMLLHTWFDDSNRQPLCGAYYVYGRRR